MTASPTEVTIQFEAPGMDAVRVRRDVEYRDGLGLDVYAPPDASAPLPAVILVVGYPGEGSRARFGRSFKEMGFSTSLGRLLAASGLACVTYDNREPAADLDALVAYLRREGAGLGVDAARLGVWASSGHVPLAVSLLTRADLRCAVLWDGFLLDLDGSTAVADAAAQFGFVNPATRFEDLPENVPLFVARAGRDQFPGLTAGLDRFVARALARNLPLTCVNHPEAPHAFELFHPGPATEAAIRQMLEFLRACLLR
jgi:dienelactone hydrolase